MSRGLISSQAAKRRVCFMTGTRSEYGLMQSTLKAIYNHPKLELQIIATGMHLSAKHGRTVNSILADGWNVDARVPWPWGADENQIAIQTGKAIAGIASAIGRIKTDIVLVVGDRVEAFAAATAGHISGKIVAHIHGGDRALGQIDDSLRHAITKLSHLHFPATLASKERILKLGEDRQRVHFAGSPGIDGICKDAVSSNMKPLQYALLILHPTDADEDTEEHRAELLLRSVRKIGFGQVVIVYPNNDPGSAGIIRCWQNALANETIYRDVPREKFLGLMRDAAVLIGNSSSGIIEAASFGTPVVDVGPRQTGRECSSNCIHVPFSGSEIEKALRRLWNGGKPIRFKTNNVYGGDGTGKKIAEILARTKINAELKRKLIAY